MWRIAYSVYVDSIAYSGDTAHANANHRPLLLTLSYYASTGLILFTVGLQCEFYILLSVDHNDNNVQCAAYIKCRMCM